MGASKMMRAVALAALLAGASASQPDERLLKKVASWRSERRLSSENNGQRHASVHWRYQSPLGGQAVDAWYNQVTPTSSSKTTYFSVMGHAFGYAGIQQIGNDPFTGMVIFSIWDPGSCSDDDMNACDQSKRANVTQCGPGVTCTRFGNEGSGAKTFLDFHEWQVGDSYQFLLKARQLPEGKAEYTCWFHAEGHGEAFDWRLMASIVIDTEGWIWSIHNMYSFVEMWTAKDADDRRSAAFGPALVRGHGADAVSWNQITSARWTTHNRNEVTAEGSGHGDVTDEHINGEVTAAGDKWELTIGGFVEKEAEYNQVFTVPASPTCPSALLEAVAKDVDGQLPTAPPKTSVYCGGGNDGDGGRARYADTCAECYEGYVWSCLGECSYDYADAACKPAARRLAYNDVMCIPDGYNWQATTCDQDPSCHAQCEDPPNVFSECFGASGAAFSDCKQRVQAECCKGLGYSTGFCCNDKSQRVKDKDVCMEEDTTTQTTTTEPEASSATASVEPGTTMQATAGEPDSSSGDSPSPATTSAEPSLTETPSESGGAQTTEDAEDTTADPSDFDAPSPTGTEDAEIESTSGSMRGFGSAAAGALSACILVFGGE